MQENRGIKKDIVLYSILSAIVGYFGISGFTMLLFVYPVFSIVLGKKYGTKQNIFNLISSGLAIIIVSGVQYLPIIFIFAIMSIVMGISINKKEKISSSISKGTAVIFIGIVLSFFVLFEFYDINYIKDIGDQISLQSKDLIEALKRASLDNNEVLKTINSYKRIIDSTAEAMKVVIPSILLIGTFIGVFITYQLSYFILRKDKNSKLDPIKMSNFRMNKNYSFGITLGIILMFVIYFINKDIYDGIFANISLLIFTLMFFQGIGMISYLFDRLKYNRILKYILFIVSMFFSFLMIAVSFIGMIDMLFNFRKIKD